jgi:hypothetical protein
VAGPSKGAAPRRPACVALTQEHRGHGVSTATYYLGRALVEQGFHVLLGDLSQRPSTIASLAMHHPIKNLVPWTPPLVPPRELPHLLESARKKTEHLADVILIDADMNLLEGAGGLAAGLDYIVMLIEHTPEAASAAERTVARLEEGARSGHRIGVVFSRVDAPGGGDGSVRQLEHGVPVLGSLPADYLLAAGEAYSLKGGAPAQPHEAYLSALGRLGQMLTRQVPLQPHRAGTATGRVS